MITRAAASLGTNAITLDQALETPPWKSTASGMNELLVAEGYTTSAGRHVRYLAARAGVLIFVGGWRRPSDPAGVAYRGWYRSAGSDPGSGGLARRRAAHRGRTVHSLSSPRPGPLTFLTNQLYVFRRTAQAGAPRARARLAESAPDRARVRHSSGCGGHALPATKQGADPAEQVDGRQADRRIDDPAGKVGLAELHAAEDGRHEVEAEQPDEAPVEPA